MEQENIMTEEMKIQGSLKNYSDHQVMEVWRLYIVRVQIGEATAMQSPISSSTSSSE